MGKALNKAMKDRNKHNREFKAEMLKDIAERELEEAELQAIEKIVTGMDLPKNRPTTVVKLPGDVEVEVFITMSPEQEDLFIEIGRLSNMAKVGREVDVGDMVNYICVLCGSMCVPTPDDEVDLSDPIVWQALRKRVGLAKLKEMLEVISKPFTAQMEEIGKFR